MQANRYNVHFFVAGLSKTVVFCLICHLYLASDQTILVLQMILLNSFSIRNFYSHDDNT